MITSGVFLWTFNERLWRSVKYEEVYYTHNNILRRIPRRLLP